MRIRMPFRGRLVAGGLVVVLAAAGAAFWLTGRRGSSENIVFQAKVNGLYQLFTIKPDGSGLKQITHLAVKRSSVPGVEEPHWSPDGTMILFDSDYARTSKHVISLFTVKPDGSGLKRVPLVTGLFNGEAAWSPDGKNIAYTFDASSTTPAQPQGIQVAQADGSFPYALTRVEHANHNDQRPSWSPNGKWIIFTEHYGLDQSQILRVRDVGGTPIPLTPFELNANNAKWSPDGTTILFNSHNDAKPDQNANLYTMSANGSRLVQITHYRGGLHAFANGWSPDGTEIIFHLRGTRRNGSTVNQLFIMDMANRSLRQLTHMSDDMNPGYADWH
jgi:Tol biopolymer transport system component